MTDDTTCPDNFTTFQDNIDHFAGLRFGMFVHFGLYSMLGRGEWVLNREQLPVDDYTALADQFDPVDFDADKLVQLAVTAGAKYLTFTTMHHDGFALYDSAVNPFNSARRGCRRDLVQEVVQTCRRYGMRIHLYHSLNNWTASPSAVDALESPAAYDTFIKNTHERLRELVTLFNPIDCLWYDGWWPFNAQGWQSQTMNDMVRDIQPHIIFNGRNGLPGDFATPEQHLSAPAQWRPWEACVTHNNSWGYHAGDHGWKPIYQVIDMIVQVAAGAGNLLLNVGPDGTGTVPAQSRHMLEQVGQFMRVCGEGIYDSERFTLDLRERGDHRSDFTHHGRYTAKGNRLYIHLMRWPGTSFAIAGAEMNVTGARLAGSDTEVTVRQHGTRVQFDGLPDSPANDFGDMLIVECDGPPSLYNTAGIRVPDVPHPRYDPVESDIIV